MTFIDVGANIGLYSLTAWCAFPGQVTCWAFEPASVTFRLLQGNVTLNRAFEVNTVNMAVSDVCTKSSLITPNGKGDAYSYLGAKPTSDAADELVAVTSLDSFEPLRERRVDVIKLDVEGGELAALHGSIATIRSNPRIVIAFECYDGWCRRAGHDRSDVFEFLASLGLRVGALHPATGVLSSEPGLLADSVNFWAARSFDRLSELAC